MSKTIKIAPFGDNVEIGRGSKFPTVLAKFYFTNRNHLPQGIPEHKREGNSEMDKRHFKEAYQAGYGHLAANGRVRDGRVDTGNNFIKNLQSVQAACLVRGLSNRGYQLTQCHWFLKNGESAAFDKCVVVLGFSCDDQVGAPETPSTLLSDKAVEQRRALARSCWKYCHGWANPDGVLTLNFGGRMPGMKPQHSIIVRNGAMTAARITDMVSEDEE